MHFITKKIKTKLGHQFQVIVIVRTTKEEQRRMVVVFASPMVFEQHKYGFFSLVFIHLLNQFFFSFYLFEGWSLGSSNKKSRRNN